MFSAIITVSAVDAELPARVIQPKDLHVRVVPIEGNEESLEVLASFADGSAATAAEGDLVSWVTSLADGLGHNFVAGEEFYIQKAVLLPPGQPTEKLDSAEPVSLPPDDSTGSAEPDPYLQSR